MNSHSSPYRPRGFSLIELLVVMAVIVVLMGLIVPAVSNFGRSTSLVTGGKPVANLAAFARQNAITKNTATALVLLGAQGTEDDYRSFTVLEYNDGRGWSQITPWQKLPTGITVDVTGASDKDDKENGTFLKNPGPFPFLTRPGPKQENPPVRYEGAQVKSWGVRVFMPNGSLQYPESPAQLRLVEGFNQGTRTAYTRPAADGKTTANYYDIALIGATGIAKIDRP